MASTDGQEPQVTTPTDRGSTDRGSEGANAAVAGRTMRADARRNYDRLLGAARKVLADQGAGAPMEAVAKEAGVGVGTLYRHFPKRIDLVEALYRDDVDTLVAAAQQAVDALGPWEAVEAWLKAYVDYARAKRLLLNELREAFEKNPGLKSSARERAVAACQLVLRRAQEAGVARTDVDGDDLMQLVSPMCTSPTLTPDQTERLVPLVLDGLRRFDG